MTGQGDEGAAIVREDVVEKTFEPCFLSRIALALVGRPERVGFGEAGLELVAGIGTVNVGFAAATITRMDADGFAKQLGRAGKRVNIQPAKSGIVLRRWAYLFHHRHKGMTAWELQAGKGHIRRCQAPIQGTGVVRLRGWNLLGRDFRGPEAVGILGLLDAFFGDVSVGPAGGGVSIQLRPIALSCDQQQGDDD